MRMTPTMQITADEINCLIYSYLQDSGFQHTAFSLRIEGHLDASPFSSFSIRRGELVELLAKALLYSEVEAHWKADETSSTCKAPFSLLQDHVCSPFDRSDKPLLPVAATFTPRPSLQNGHPSQETSDSAKQQVVDKVSRPDYQANTITQRPDNSMDIDAGARRSQLQTTLGPPSAVTLLRGHQTEVFVCSWNPKNPALLATGARDGSMRLWRFKSWDSVSLLNKATLTQEDVLAGGSVEMNQAISSTEEQADVTSIEWNSDGTLLASGCFDGTVRIWSTDSGITLHKKEHNGPIFSVKFDAESRWLLTAGFDGVVCLWSVQTKTLIYKFSCHTDPCLDVEWLDSCTFASGSADKKVHIWNISDRSSPLVVFEGHSHEVNQIRANKHSSLLASCSDDTTVRVWDVTGWHNEANKTKGRLQGGTPQTESALTVLRGHTEAIGSISWRPTSSGVDTILATASFDATCRLWDAISGHCLRVFADNRKPVFTLSFSTDGAILATGGGDGLFQLYDVDNIWKWVTDPDAPGVYEIEWQDSEKVAVCLENHSVALVDLARIPSLPRKSIT